MLGRVGSICARQLDKRAAVYSVITGVIEAYGVEMSDKWDILSLPLEVLSNVSSWLDDWESCKMEVACKTFYTALSNPCGPPRARLNLGARSMADGDDDMDEAPQSEAPPRWLLKRILRYGRIVCDFSDASMLVRREPVGEGTADCYVPALLPSLLATCSLSAELRLLGGDP
ncbi:g10102 [Coccomyxa viridis]|uniref:G10102 protein n=1 Tax=Coccomyxa viridis TaxID=1274662 RepID=A0ABP1G4Y4_9CHLO